MHTQHDTIPAQIDLGSATDLIRGPGPEGFDSLGAQRIGVGLQDD